MERYLGRELLPNEDVHHIDGDVTNNSIDNLMIIPHGEHQGQHKRIYYDKIAKCQICGKEFIWTANRQKWYHTDLNRNKLRIITCSKKCSSYYGRMNYLKRSVDLIEQ